MSEHATIRKRLSALDGAIASLEAWPKVSGGGYVEVLSDRMAVDACKYGSEDQAPGVWISAGGLYAMLRALRGDLEDMAQRVEAHAAKHGAVVWEEPAP